MTVTFHRRRDLTVIALLSGKVTTRRPRGGGFKRSSHGASADVQAMLKKLVEQILF